MIFTRDPETTLDDFDGVEPPKKLLVSLTSDCPNHCDHCMRAVSDGFWSVPPGRPLPEWILAEIEKLLPGVRSVRLGGVDYGEQLFSPHIERFLTTLSLYPSIYVQVMSGLSVMDATKADLIAGAVDLFEWSMEGVGEGYEAVRHVPWARVRRNLQMLVEARERHPASKLRIDVVVTCFRDNLGHLEEILDLANQGVDQFHFRRFVPNSPRQELQKLEYYRDEANRVFERLLELGRQRGIPVVCAAPFPMPTLAETTSRRSARPEAPGAAPPDKLRKWVCHFPFEAIKIDTDATVGACCVRMDLGRLNEETPDLLSVWRGEGFRSLRKAVSIGDWPAACLMCEFRASQLDWLQVG
jgi:MoaA/NifB/PqqE/SkfB family radical SAM enzyme